MRIRTFVRVRRCRAAIVAQPESGRIDWRDFYVSAYGVDLQLLDSTGRRTCGDG